MENQTYDFVIIGSGVSGSFIARELTRGRASCLMLEAGSVWDKSNYPHKEIDAASRLYWSGGMELNHSATLGFLRAKCVGGGSVVNQALLDRFDDLAFNDWRAQSGVPFFNSQAMAPYYEKAEASLALQSIPEKFYNRNAQLFAEGFRKNGYRFSVLRRAQVNCRTEEGYDCLDCLSGCPIDSKQSMPITILKQALENGLTLVPDLEVTQIEKRGDIYRIFGVDNHRDRREFRTKNLVLAAGSFGNVRLLNQSRLTSKSSPIGCHFFMHPQFMFFARYKERIDAHRGPFQSLKSDDPNFRQAGFKLENVFCPPVSLAMLLPASGRVHANLMKHATHLGCIEVAVRDVSPGKIRFNKNGKLVVEKELGPEDWKRKKNGEEAVRNIFAATNAEEIIEGSLAFGLHLMGGCGMGTDPNQSVVNPDFQLHDDRHVFIADSSVFPNAPGINPSLTIMALSLAAAQIMLKH
jgi:choline dehydrogenase-like flavoprotein